MGGSSREMTESYPRYNGKIRGPEIRHIYNDRLSQFTDGGEFRDVNLLSMLYHGRVDDTEYLQLEVYSPPKLSRPLFHEATRHVFRPTSKGEMFGPSWSTHWFKVTIKAIPKEWGNYERVQLEFDLPEGLVYDESGTPLQGLTGGPGGARRVEFILSHDLRQAKLPIVLYIETSMNGLFGVGNGSTIQPPDPDRYFRLNSADLVAPNMDAWKLFWDFWIIKDISRELAEKGQDSHRALRVANKIMNTFRRGDPTCLKECRKVAAEVLGDQIDSEAVYISHDRPLVTAVGHCHIDTAWLWPFAETKRKIARSWSTQCDLMQRYPEHIFTCSQAQQFKWLGQDYPKLFDKVSSMIQKGTFEPIGGTWVEMDTNMPSGEALCRQFLLGQRYFEKNFGKRCTVFWLPDTFGYSSQLPQLCRLAGMSSFFTQKLSWNNINDFPQYAIPILAGQLADCTSTTFNWQGLDGSQVLTHMAPDETYTAQADLGDVIRSESQHKSMTDDVNSLLVFGNGDGGGGPLAEMMEKLRRCRGASDNGAKSLPKVAMGSVTNFFAQLEQDTDHGKNLRSWAGELYFELHRGTYTSQAKTKMYNRSTEILLREIEHYASLAYITNSSRYKYPRDEINALWEDVLLCQFHDVLPGSSIGMVYVDEHKIHQDVMKNGQALLNRALQALGLQDEHEPSSSHLAAINVLPWDRREIVQSGDTFMTIETGPRAPTVATKLDGDVVLRDEGHARYVLTNQQLSVLIVDGQIHSLYDKTVQRELVPQDQPMLKYELYEDQPLNWQAWDVELFHLDKIPTVLAKGESSITVNTSNRATIQTKFKISEVSWIVSEISLDSSHISEGSPCKQLNVSCEVEWHENKTFLKVAFPTMLHAQEATYETQFGLVKRPTHFNTTWDEAKFEVCCHKFADLSEYNYGISILNDCKYGFATHGHVMRLSLLRAPKAPDDTADMGRHTFRFAIVAHSASFEASSIVRKGYEFNSPIKLTRSLSKEPLSHFTIRGDNNVILDTIKLAEDSNNIVLRCYESLGGQGRASIDFPSKIASSVKSVSKTNILEDHLEMMQMRNNTVPIVLKPFEVQTYLIRLELEH